MKKLKLFSALGLFLVLMSSTGTLTAQRTIWCGWDEQLFACHLSGYDGYCAYTGPDCTTTIPTVE